MRKNIIILAVVVLAGCDRVKYNSGDHRIIKQYDGTYYIETYYPSLSWHSLGYTKYDTLDQAKAMTSRLRYEDSIVE